MTDASTETETATLQFPGGTAEFPIVRGTDGHDSIDISTFSRVWPPLCPHRSNTLCGTWIRSTGMEILPRPIAPGALI